MVIDFLNYSPFGIWEKAKLGKPKDMDDNFFAATVVSTGFIETSPSWKPFFCKAAV